MVKGTSKGVYIVKEIVKEIGKEKRCKWTRV